MTGDGASFGARIRSRDDIHVIAALTAITAWAIGPLFTKSMSVGVPSIVFYRITIGTPVMIAMSYRFGNGLSIPLLKKTALPGLLFGSSMLAGFAGIRMTSVANATLIGNMQPVLIIFLAPKLFGERLRARQLLFAGTALAGVLTVVLAAASTSGAHLSGDLMSVLNVFIWTAYFLMAKQRRLSGVDGWSFLAAAFCWSCLIVIPFGAIASNDLGQVTARDILFVMCMAMGPGVVGHGLMTWSQSHLDVTLASILGLLGPVISTVLAWIVFGESLTILQLVGGVVVIGALSLLVKDQRGPAESVVAHETS